MKLRNMWIVLAVVAVAACGGAAEEPATDSAAAAAVAAEAPTDDGAAIRALVDDLVVHYNLHHASMVADFYTDDAVVLAANGSVLMSREGRVASLESDMAGDPTLGVEVVDVIVVGDAAVARGSYSIATAPEGTDPASFSGSWMAGYTKVDGAWKSSVLLTNYDADPPENRPDPVAPEGPPPPDLEDDPMAELMGYYATHYNMGHGGMVASRYAEDAVAGFANEPMLEGRAAIEENMNARIAELGNPQLTIHQVAAEEIGDGYVFGGGWYELSSDSGNSQGSFLVLARTGDDGNLQIQWAVSNGLPIEQ
jgi:uncharacterized protein (TIGR02246 family)